MTEENVIQEVTKIDDVTSTEVDESNWFDTLPSEAQQEIKRLRKENANKRVQNKERDAELAEFKKWKESQMTELEKAQSKIAELEKSGKEVRQIKAAREAGLDLELAGFVIGDSEEDMLESAKLLASKVGTAGTGTPNVSGAGSVRRGSAITDNGDDKKARANAFFTDLMRNAR